MYAIQVLNYLKYKNNWTVTTSKFQLVSPNGDIPSGKAQWPEPANHKAYITDWDVVDSDGNPVPEPTQQMVDDVIALPASYLTNSENSKTHTDDPVDAFPFPPYDGQTVVRGNLDNTVWTYVQAVDEWHSPGGFLGFGTNNPVRSNRYFKLYNGQSMSATLGLPIGKKIRLQSLAFNWRAQATGSVELELLRDDEGRSFSFSNDQYGNRDFGNDKKWVIGDNDSVTCLPLSAIYRGPTNTASISGQCTLQFTLVRETNE